MLLGSVYGRTTPPQDTVQSKGHINERETTKPADVREPRGGNGLSILVMGKHGTGKSTLIQGLFGKVVERKGRRNFDVPSVTMSYLSIDGVPLSITFWNSPGIYNDGVFKDEECIEKMRGFIQKLDLVICTMIHA